MLLKGTHGTCVSASEEIKENGFYLNNGRRGTGAYFWAYRDTTKPIAKALAFAWWNFYKSTKRYDAYKDPSYACLNVHIDSKVMLDLEEHEMKHRLSEFVRKISQKAKQRRQYNLVKNAYDLFIREMEAEQDTNFDVIYVSVNPPNREYFSQNDVENGNILTEHFCPGCYVVRNKDCIQVR